MSRLLLLALLLASGCAKKQFAVEVAHGFTGYVHIVCGPDMGVPARPVEVDALGGGDAQACPGGDAEVKVLRDGRAVPTLALHWERNGDGTPVSLSFNVQ